MRYGNRAWARKLGQVLCGLAFFLGGTTLSAVEKGLSSPGDKSAAGMQVLDEKINWFPSGS